MRTGYPTECVGICWVSRGGVQHCEGHCATGFGWEYTSRDCWFHTLRMCADWYQLFCVLSYVLCCLIKVNSHLPKFIVAFVLLEPAINVHCVPVDGMGRLRPHWFRQRWLQLKRNTVNKPFFVHFCMWSCTFPEITPHCTTPH